MVNILKGDPAFRGKNTWEEIGKKRMERESERANTKESRDRTNRTIKKYNMTPTVKQLQILYTKLNVFSIFDIVIFL